MSAVNGLSFKLQEQSLKVQPENPTQLSLPHFSAIEVEALAVSEKPDYSLLENLNDNNLLMIMQKLSLRDLVQLKRTSRRFYLFITENKLIEKKFKEFPEGRFIWFNPDTLDKSTAPKEGFTLYPNDFFEMEVNQHFKLQHSMNTAQINEKIALAKTVTRITQFTVRNITLSLEEISPLIDAKVLSKVRVCTLTERINFTKLQQLISAMPELRTLTVTLSKPNVKVIDLTHLKDLQELSLVCENFCRKDIKAISETSIQKLTLDTASCFRTKDYVNLNKLSLKDFKINYTRALAHALSTLNFIKLETFALTIDAERRNDRLSERIVTRQVSDFLRRYKDIKHLDLRGLPVADSIAFDFPECLETLNISNTHFSEKGIRLIAEKCLRLKIIELAGFEGDINLLDDLFINRPEVTIIKTEMMF